MRKPTHYLIVAIVLACVNFGVAADEGPQLYTFENPDASPLAQEVIDRGPSLKFSAKDQEMSLVSGLPAFNLSILISTHADKPVDQIEPRQITETMSRMVLPLASTMLNRRVEKPNTAEATPNLSLAGGELLMTTEGADLDISMLLSPRLPLKSAVSVPVKDDEVISGNCDCYRCQCDAPDCADFCDICWTIIDILKFD